MVLSVVFGWVSLVSFMYSDVLGVVSSVVILVFAC